MKDLYVKSIEETICCCKNYDLTVDEYKSYIELKRNIIQSYDESNKYHEDLLNNLSIISNEILQKQKLNSSENTESKTITDSISTTSTSKNSKNENIFKILGFQTNNPRTDFRAGGIFSLNFMIFFIEKNKNKFINILNEKYFPFALVCIRLSYLIRVFLHLLPQDELNVNIRSKKFLIAGRKELKCFARELTNNHNLLCEMIGVCLYLVFDNFQKKQNYENKEQNFLIIEPIILQIVEHLKNVLSNANENSNLLFQLK